MDPAALLGQGPARRPLSDLAAAKLGGGPGVEEPAVGGMEEDMTAGVEPRGVG